MRRDVFRKRLSLTALLMAVVCFFCACGRSAGTSSSAALVQSKQDSLAEEGNAEKEELPEQVDILEQDSIAKEEAAARSLQDFCSDEELNAWFNSLENDPPVKLSYVIFGEAPVTMEFTDSDLIRRTAEALQTVKIGGESEDDPDNTADGGGSGYYFTGSDGSQIGFTFMLGSFRWKGGTWHDVENWGELSAVSTELNRIGNPPYVHVYSQDEGFYTRCRENCVTVWRDESSWDGGLTIYDREENKLPYIQICRTDGDAKDPENYLMDELADQMTQEIEAAGGSVLKAGDLKEYAVGGKHLPGILYTVSTREYGIHQLLVLVMKKADSKTREDRLIRLCAAYTEEDSEEQKTAGKMLNAAVQDFVLKYMYQEEKKEVQAGSLLLDFCNDDDLRKWFEDAEKKLPDELIYMADTWYTITDPDMIRKTLEAIQTVKIGGVSDAHVGGSGRQIFTFYDHETDDSHDFMFFQSTFDWNNESYDVIDWGSLDDLDLREAASSSGNG